VLLIRAILAWVVVFAVLLLFVGTLGFISIYELWIILVLSIGLTVLALRLWDRWHEGRARSTPSS
jgi:hypothetical protein